VQLRVVAYNVRGFRQGLGRVVRVAELLEPDVLLLNESGGRLRLRRFARAVGMELARDPWSPLRRRVKNAVLVRPPWVVLEHRLNRFEGGSFLLPRGALVARLGRDGLRLLAIATHLGLHPGERLRHARELVGLLARPDGAVVLGGDLNETPERRARSPLRAVRDAWLAAGEGRERPSRPGPDRAYRLRVRDRGIAVERARVAQEGEARRASDHRPLVAELRCPSGDRLGSARSGAGPWPRARGKEEPMLSPDVEAAMNGQIAAELYSSHLYLAMSVYCESVDLPGSARWFAAQSDEERAHALKFVRHVVERGGRVTLVGVDPPPADFGSVLGAFEQALTHEMNVSQMIDGLFGLAVQHGDYASQAFLPWFVTELVEVERPAGEVGRRLRAVGSDPAALLMLDRELGSREVEA
jgi:ferritin